MKNPYKTESHRLAFDQAVQLIQSGVDDRFEVAKLLDHNIQREMRFKIAAKAARSLNNDSVDRGTPPNTSVVLTNEELAFIKTCYGGQKSKAIHDGLRLLVKATNC